MSAAVQQDPLAIQMIVYIKEHSDCVNLQDLSEEFCYNPNYLSGYLKRKTGKRFTEIREEQRMARARQLLLETDLAVDDIADMVGYQDVGYFCRIFKRNSREAVTPAAVRRMA